MLGPMLDQILLTSDVRLLLGHTVIILIMHGYIRLNTIILNYMYVNCKAR